MSRAKFERTIEQEAYLPQTVIGRMPVKVLLFSQNGNAQPWVVPTGARNEAAIRFAAAAMAPFFCDRWWLVQCSGAAAGLLTIEDWRRNGSYKGSQLPNDYAHGRILAFGGKP